MIFFNIFNPKLNIFQKLKIIFTKYKYPYNICMDIIINNAIEYGKIIDYMPNEKIIYKYNNSMIEIFIGDTFYKDITMGSSVLYQFDYKRPSKKVIIKFWNWVLKNNIYPFKKD